MSAPTNHSQTTDEFFRLALEYYIAARAALPCGIASVTGNLLHHAVEMLLKGHLSRTTSLDDLKYAGHKLPKIWTDFRQLFPHEDLTEFDAVIKSLDPFDFIRYPDQITKGAFIALGMGRAHQGAVRGKGGAVPKYQIGLGDIDAMFARLFPLCRINPHAYFSFLTARGCAALHEGNEFSANWAGAT